MADTTLRTVIQVRRDTTANWELHKDVIPAAGEPCLDLDTGIIKYGDGVTTYENLKESGASASHYEGVKNDGETDNECITRVLAGLSVTPRKDDIFIVKSLISDDKYSYTAFVYNGSAWVAMDGNYSASNVFLEDQIILAGNYSSIGNYEKGDTVSAGMSIQDLLSNMLSQRLQPADPIQPEVSITFNSGAKEVGTKITPTYTATLSSGSYTYGPATGVNATGWSVVAKDGSTTVSTLTAAGGSFDEITVLDDTNYKVTATATHGDGAVALDNLGSPSNPEKKIAAGSKSKTSGAITGYRSYFYGVLDSSSADAPLTSDLVRGLTNGNAYSSSKTFTINATATAKRIVIAIPSASITSSRKGLSTVILTSAMNTPITDSYVKTVDAVQVEGVGGATAVNYTVWVYEPASIDAGEVHKITLA